MSQYQGDDMDYAAEDFEMAEAHDDMYFRVMGDSESDEDNDDDDHLDTRVTDTSAADARRGKDIQGIPWDRLSISREKYRQTRLDQYKNYENIPQSGAGSEKDCKPTRKGGTYYEFWRNTRSVKSTILHFQLRNLVWSTSKHDVYLMSHFSIVHWSSLSCKKTEVLNVSGHVAPREKHPGSLLEGFSQTQVSTLAVWDNLLIAGGFQENLYASEIFIPYKFFLFLFMMQYLDRPGVSFCFRTTYDDNAITNAVEIYDNPSGAVHFMASNNDCGVRTFDMERFQLSKHFTFSWPVNHTSLSPDGKQLVIVGDSPDGLLVDSQTGKTCRIWDAGTCLNLLLCSREIWEPLDLFGLHLMDSSWQWQNQPTLCMYMMQRMVLRKSRRSIFGEISGVSLVDTESLFMVWDRTYGSLLQYNRCRNYAYLDSFL
ncbi:hypothetical protein K2173_013135 [Erythroxylum novogranatense]|uniref:Uncharacterized protein n=1 Tax=Erythroxylum novogranatense TaxID=1862640 RepID=A0AAV8S5K1_9ROSI|nr:hypothetical protein K2173_013135 [Erythroxylum novogranatense]